MTNNSSSGKPKKKLWNYQPSLPVQVSPLFTAPFRPIGIVKWFVGSWFPVSGRLIILLISIVSWVYFHPSMERSNEFAWDWIAEIFLRNLILMFVVAGGLHLYLYTFNRQAKERQYDARPLAKNKRVFTFNNQVLDNMFWTCISGVTVWSGYEALMMWSMSNGYIPALPEADHYGWWFLLIFLIPIWETFYFYLIHRLLHWPPLYKHVHSLHHRNTNIGPWSGLSMHPIEHLLYLGSVMIHFIVPGNPLIIIYHLQYYTLSAATTHTGYEGLVFGKKNYLPLGTFHHQMHHRYFECNYGGLEIPWDIWFDSFHDGTEASHKEFIDRRTQLQAAMQRNI